MFFKLLTSHPIYLSRLLKTVLLMSPGSYNCSRRHVIFGCRELKKLQIYGLFTNGIIFTLNFVIIGHMFQKLCGGALVLFLSLSVSHTHTHTHTHTCTHQIGWSHKSTFLLREAKNGKIEGNDKYSIFLENKKRRRLCF